MDAINDLTTKLEQIASAQLDAGVRALRGEMGVAGAQAHSTSLVGPAASVILIGLCIAFGATLLRGVLRPLAGITTVMGKLAVVETDIAIPSRDARDEIGAMARAVEVFKQNAVARARLEGEQKAQEARAAQEKHGRPGWHGREDRGGDGRGAGVGRRPHHHHRGNRRGDERRGATRTGEPQGRRTAAGQALANAQTVASAAEQLAASIREISGQMSSRPPWSAGPSPPAARPAPRWRR